MIFEKQKVDGLVLIKPDIHFDERGFFLEAYHEIKYLANGVDATFVQDNHSRSSFGVLRGLHYQSEPGQAKLIRVVSGWIQDVVVDIRTHSPTFGQHQSFVLTANRGEQLYVPVGFAHGFLVKSEVAEVVYKVSTHYNAATECSIAWNDPDLNIPWMLTDLNSNPIVSNKDQKALSFNDFKSQIA